MKFYGNLRKGQTYIHLPSTCTTLIRQARRWAYTCTPVRIIFKSQKAENSKSALKSRRGLKVYSTANIHNLEFSLTIRPIHSMESVVRYTCTHE